jgi:hypothetical protein
MRNQLILYVLSFTLFFVSSCNNKQPFIPGYNNIKGYVIGKETCNSDETKDYWLIDFTYGSDNPHVGDTILVNGITFNNVLKTKGLDQQLRIMGLRVTIDYRVISSTKATSTGCDVLTPVTYSLKELTILNQGEIR